MYEIKFFARSVKKTSSIECCHTVLADRTLLSLGATRPLELITAVLVDACDFHLELAGRQTQKQSREAGR